MGDYLELMKSGMEGRRHVGATEAERHPVSSCVPEFQIVLNHGIHECWARARPPSVRLRRPLGAAFGRKI
jgi:hypothetical protein